MDRTWAGFRCIFFLAAVGGFWHQLRRDGSGPRTITDALTFPPSCRHGAQGTFDGASKSTLENEFGTTDEDEVIKAILEKGTLQESAVCRVNYSRLGNAALSPPVAGPAFVFA